MVKGSGYLVHVRLPKLPLSPWQCNHDCSTPCCPFFSQNFPRQGGIGQKQFLEAISLEGKPQNTFLGVAGGTRTCGLSGHSQIYLSVGHTATPLLMFVAAVCQVDVIGVHVQDIIHPQDCSEVSAIFQTQGHDTDHGMYCSLYVYNFL